VHGAKWLLHADIPLRNYSLTDTYFQCCCLFDEHWAAFDLLSSRCTHIVHKVVQECKS